MPSVIVLDFNFKFARCLLLLPLLISLVFCSSSKGLCFLHGIKFPEIHGNVGANNGLLKWWGVNEKSGECGECKMDPDSFHLPLIHFPWKWRSFDSHLWIFKIFSWCFTIDFNSHTHACYTMSQTTSVKADDRWSSIVGMYNLSPP